MTADNTTEMKKTIETGGHPCPYVPFPEKPKVIILNGHEVYEYISPRDMKLYLDKVLWRIQLSNYEAIVVNQKGGQFVLNQLQRRFDLSNFPIINVEYHRPNENGEQRIPVPLPSTLRNVPFLLLEDIYDRGDTLSSIDLNGGCLAVVAVFKTGVEGQILPPKNLRAAVATDNVWLGGGGMDLGSGYPDDFPRTYPGIVVKI